jgi:hypothetical protein
MPYTPPSGPFTALDVWKAHFLPLNTDGTIAVPGYPTPATEPYEGLELKKVKSMAANLGAPRLIPVVAQGSTQTTFKLPSIDPKTIEGHLAYAELETFAELTRTKTRTIGGALLMPADTNKQGFELKGALLVSQLLGHDADDADVWYSNLFLRVTASITWPAFNENPMDVTLNFSVGRAKKHIWGEAMSEANDGAVEAAMIPILTWGQLVLVGWATDGIEDTFLLPTDRPANATFADTFKVYDQTTGLVVAGTPAADQFVAGAAPADSKTLLGWYEADSGV